jgi:hypothetical protein
LSASRIRRAPTRNGAIQHNVRRNFFAYDRKLHRDSFNALAHNNFVHCHRNPYFPTTSSTLAVRHVGDERSADDISDFMAMQTLFRVLPGTTVCTKYFGDEVVITRR